MNHPVLTRQPKNPTPAPTGGLLQRDAAGGHSAQGLGSGWAAFCQENIPGLQPSLMVSRTGDPLEREADRAAALVLGGHGTGAQRLSHASRGIGRCPGAAVGRPAPSSVATVLERPGEPLGASTRAFFEPRFGHDFSHVRVHRDAEAATAARAVSARAFTVGHHLVFAGGRYAPESRSGRALLAHELAHVIQQGGSARSGRLQRAGEETGEALAADASQASTDQWVTMEVTTDPENTGQNEYKSLGSGDSAVELGTVYPGDVLLIRRFDNNMDEASDEGEWTLPAGLERIGTAESGALQLRVTTSVSGTLTIGLIRGGGTSHRLSVTVGRLPSRPQAVNPEFARLQAARQALRSERRSARRLARAERRVARGETPEARRSQRVRRRAQRRHSRTQARALRREARALRRSETCGLDTQRQIQAALESAIAVTARALSRLHGPDALSDPAVTAALSRYMRWTPSDVQSAASARHHGRIVDTLTVARNNMLLAVHGDFECTLDCKETTGAYVTEGSRRRSQIDSGVTVCPTWITGSGLRFAVVSGREDARAYALLHEFIHKAGPFAEEAGTYYVGRPAWQGLGAAEALGYADGYAALAWTLGGSGEVAP